MSDEKDGHHPDNNRPPAHAEYGTAAAAGRAHPLEVAPIVEYGPDHGVPPPAPPPVKRSRKGLFRR